MSLIHFVESNGMMMNMNLFQNILYGVLGSLSLYLVAWKNVDEATDRFARDNKGDAFDFVIVGAGSAGAVLANRLSINYSVLLLEAGGEPHPFQFIPSFSTFMVNYPENDWQYYTVPQRHGFFAQNHQECLLSAGLGLGGTSGINFLMHNRGNPKDYDNWAKILDDPEWSYDALLPYFKVSENFIGNYKAGGPDDLHGKHGEMTIQRPDYTGMGAFYLQAAKEKGYNVTDLNGRYTEGFDYVYYPLHHGQRVSTHTAFLEPIKFRRHLTVRKYSHVTKVVFKEGSENEAYGVEYIRHRVKKMAFAHREIILSAGAINSPKILMQSGIGPKNNLEAVKLDVRKDLPVGQNLQDHTAVYLGPFFINRTFSLDIDQDFKLGTFVDFLVHGHGPFTTSGTNAQGFFASSVAQSAGESEWPDTHLTMLGVSVCKQCDVQLARAFNFREDVIKAYYEHAKGKNSFMQLVSNGRPHSRGQIMLRSSNPRIPPAIDPSYLDNEHDIKVMVEGIKTAVELVENSTTFQKLGTKFTDEKFPGCQEEEFRSDAYWECFVRQYTVSLHHLVGSCSMSKSEEAGGVVDTQFRVFGTKRLRVVDASVMPSIPVGNTNWPTIMIGEKGAETVIRFWESTDQNSGNSTEVPVEADPSLVSNRMEVKKDSLESNVIHARS